MPFPKEKPEYKKSSGITVERGKYKSRVLNKLNHAISMDMFDAKSISKGVSEKKLSLKAAREIAALTGESAVSLAFEKDLKSKQFVDFRLATPTLVQFDLQTTKSLKSWENSCRFISKLVYQLSEVGSYPFAKMDIMAEVSENPEQLARSAMANLGLTGEVWRRADSETQYYRRLRLAIEQRGISVVHDSINVSGFRGAYMCENSSDHGLILINTRNQNQSSRTFTLLHEFSHSILRLAGVSDSYRTKNEVEVFCNRFAAASLMPRDYFNADAENQIRNFEGDINGLVTRLARLYKVSKHATAIRLKELNFISRSDLKRWENQFTQGEFPEDKTAGGGGAPDQGGIKLTRLGFHVAFVCLKALDLGLVSEAQVYKYTRLKPRFIESLQDSYTERLAELEEI